MDQKSKNELKFVTWAIDHQKALWAALVILLAVGMAGLFRMNRDEFPTFQIKWGLVAGIYPGASAEEVKVQLAEPLEELLLSIPEVNRSKMQSHSKDGICYITIDVNTPASQKEVAWSKIRHRLEAAKLTLPPGVVDVVVIDDYSETSSLLIAMESNDKGYSELLGYANELCRRLRHIPKLSKATVYGAQDEEIAVDIDLERLSTYGISPAQLMLEFQASTASSSFSALSNNNVNSPIHISSTVTGEQEVEDKVVYVDLDGNTLRLKDIATIERRYVTPAPYVAYNGHNALVINVSMSGDNNIVDFGEDVEKVLSEFRENLPDSVTLSRITDQPKAVKQSIMGFLRDLFIAMLVVILVMLMLFPMRSALIAGSGVPVCTAMTLAVMYITKMQLNTVTLAALIVVLGMIVDDSIITMDGYMDKLGKGMGRREAALESSRQLFMPMFMATLAISLMFFPTKKIIKGYLGDFVQPFPWIIAIALGFSLIYAMLFVPSMEIRFISSEKANVNNPISRMQNRFFAFIQRIYDRAEAFCFRHSALTVLSGVAAIALGLFMFSKLNVQMMPKLSRDCFAVEIYLDDNSSLERTSMVADSLSNIILADTARIESVTAFVGESAPRFHCTYSPALPGDNVAQLIVNTKSNKATVDALYDMEAEYEHLFPDALIRFKQMDYEVEGAVAITLKGAPVEDLKPFADSIRNYMYGMDDMLKWVHSDCDDYVAGVNVAIDQDEASRLGINRATLALTLGETFNGFPVATLYEDGKKVSVNVYCGSYGNDVDYSDIESLLIPGLKPYESVPLSQIAAVTPDWTLPDYPRYMGEDGITLYADMRMGKAQPAAMKQIRKYIDENIQPGLPDGAEVYYGGLDSTNGEIFPQVAFSFLAAVLVLFIFLLIHFKKTGIATLTMVLSLLCLFGASLGLWIFDMDFTITAVLGLISLVGIIVRNGIIMFDYAEELRHERGMSVYDAAMLAGQRRMRPIFLTSCTTALGVLPMILGGDFMWMPMGIIIAFGTLLSISLIVLIMPVTYWLSFRKSDSKGNAGGVAKLAAAAVLLCVSPSLFGQETTSGEAALPREWSLEQCLDMSERNDPYLKNARLDISSARAQKGEAVWNFFPDVSINGVAYRASDPLLRLTITDIIGTSDAAWDIRNAIENFAYQNGLKSDFRAFNKGLISSVTAIQPLYAGGRVVNGNRLAAIGIEAAELQKEMKERDTRQDVEEKYWLVVSLQEKQKTLEEGKRLLDTLYKDVLSARNAGLVLESDVELVALKKKETAAAEVQLRGGLRLAKINLFNSIGVNCSFRELDSLHFTDSIVSLEDPSEVIASLSEQEPVESRLMDINLQAKKLEKRMAMGENLPEVGLGYSYGYFDPSGIATGNLFHSILFASVKIPITGLGKMAYKAKRFENEVLKVQNEKEYIDSQLELRRQKMMLDFETAYENAKVAEDALAAARGAEARIRADYGAGRATLSELLKAELDVRTADGEYIDSCIGYHKALSALRSF